MRATGIDISRYQGKFTYQNNHDFIIVKATEGTTWVDPEFENNLPEVQKVPIRGAYHYFRTEYDPIAQAEHFYNTTKDKGFHFLCVDYEGYNNVLNQEGLTNLGMCFAELESLVNPVFLYTSPYIYRDNILAYDNIWIYVPLWMAHYNGQDPQTGAPQTWGNDWKMWQYSADGNGKGAEYGVQSADVDLNVYNGTVEEMKEWLGLGGEPPVEPPADCCCADLAKRVAELEKKAHLHPSWMDRFFRK
jgi:lysozyme